MGLEIRGLNAGRLLRGLVREGMLRLLLFDTDVVVFIGSGLIWDNPPLLRPVFIWSERLEGLFCFDRSGVEVVFLGLDGSGMDKVVLLTDLGGLFIFGLSLACTNDDDEDVFDEDFEDVLPRLRFDLLLELVMVLVVSDPRRVREYGLLSLLSSMVPVLIP